MKIGYKLIAEAHAPQEIVDQAVRAEEAGFDFVEISDHFHPWFDSQGHSGFVWSILAAAAMRTTLPNPLTMSNPRSCASTLVGHLG